MIRTTLVLLIGLSMLLSLPVQAGGKHGHDDWNHGGKKHHKHQKHHGHHGYSRGDRHYKRHGGRHYAANYQPAYYANSHIMHGAVYSYRPQETIIVYQSPNLHLGIRY